VRVIEHAENIDDELRSLNAKFNSRHMLSSVLIIKNLVLFFFFVFKDNLNVWNLRTAG